MRGIRKPIALVDGPRLARLMIEHGVGVRRVARAGRKAGGGVLVPEIPISMGTPADATGESLRGRSRGEHAGPHPRFPRLGVDIG